MKDFKSSLVYPFHNLKQYSLSVIYLVIASFLGFAVPYFVVSKWIVTGGGWDAVFGIILLTLIISGLITPFLLSFLIAYSLESSLSSKDSFPPFSSVKNLLTTGLRTVGVLYIYGLVELFLIVLSQLPLFQGGLIAFFGFLHEIQAVLEGSSLGSQWPWFLLANIIYLVILFFLAYLLSVSLYNAHRKKKFTAAFRWSEMKDWVLSKTYFKSFSACFLYFIVGVAAMVIVSAWLTWPTKLVLTALLSIILFTAWLFTSTDYLGRAYRELLSDSDTGKES